MVEKYIKYKCMLLPKYCKEDTHTTHLSSRNESVNTQEAAQTPLSSHNSLTLLLKPLSSLLSFL